MEQARQAPNVLAPMETAKRCLSSATVIFLGPGRARGRVGLTCARHVQVSACIEVVGTSLAGPISTR